MGQLIVAKIPTFRCFSETDAPFLFDAVETVYEDIVREKEKLPEIMGFYESQRLQEVQTEWYYDKTFGMPYELVHFDTEEAADKNSDDLTEFHEQFMDDVFCALGHLNMCIATEDNEIFSMPLIGVW